jgi:chromate reductase, NAD(P)H dehydrogenase (quinone)
LCHSETNIAKNLKAARQGFIFLKVGIVRFVRQRADGQRSKVDFVVGNRRTCVNPWEIIMSQYKIAVIVGSLRRDSINRKLATAMARLAPADFSFKQVEIGGLPFYNQDDDSNQAEPVKRLKADILAAQGLLFVTAEYNRSIPGVLKNAIDHASRPYGQSAWAGKPAGILGASVGSTGTCMAQQHLRNILAYLDVPTLGQPEAFIHAKEGLFDDAGNIGEASKMFLQDWMDRYVAWVKKHSD